MFYRHSPPDYRSTTNNNSYPYHAIFSRTCVCPVCCTSCARSTPHTISSELHHPSPDELCKVFGVVVYLTDFNARLNDTRKRGVSPAQLITPQGNSLYKTEVSLEHNATGSTIFKIIMTEETLWKLRTNITRRVDICSHVRIYFLKFVLITVPISVLKYVLIYLILSIHKFELIHGCISVINLVLMAVRLPSLKFVLITVRISVLKLVLVTNCISFGIFGIKLYRHLL